MNKRVGVTGGLELSQDCRKGIDDAVCLLGPFILVGIYFD